MRVVFAGEALIDFASVGDLRFQGYPGGSPLNAAVAAARLGASVGYVTQLSTDLFGTRLRRHLETNGVDTMFVLSHPAPTTLAFVERDAETNRYQFLANGSADSLYAPDSLPTLPDETAFLHFGSVSLLAEPASSAITRLVERHRDRLTVVFDPNVRPSLIHDADAYRHRCEEWIRMCHILRLSEEDADYLAADRDVADAIARWLEAGPRAVVVTSGRGGATYYGANGEHTSVPAFEIDVVDTIGAGDAFTAAVTVDLLERGVTRPEQLGEMSAMDWHAVLRFAAAAAAINCTRPGADAPTLAEVQELLGRSPAGPAR